MAYRHLKKPLPSTIVLLWAVAVTTSFCTYAQAKEPRPSSGSLADTQDEPGRIYAVIVANNSSVDANVASLRYADDDGARYWELFSALTDQVHLLTTLDNDSQALFKGLARKTKQPSRTRVLETLDNVSKAIAADRAANIKTTLFVVFTGHGSVDDDGVGYLSLSDGPFTRKDLHQHIIAPEIADRTHLIIDACHAYYMVRSRDGKANPDDRSGQTYDDEFAQFIERSGQRAQAPTVGVFLSTAGAAEVHEWSRYRGGVFSHQLRSGLLGAADVDGDLAITYQELDAYLASANASVTNPRAKVNVFARAPAQFRSEPLVDLRQMRRTSFLELETQRSGRYHLEDSRGVRYADFNKAGDGVMRLALLWSPLSKAPYYFVRTGETEARISPKTAEEPEVKLSALSFVERPDSARGSVEEAYRSSLFAIPFGRGFYEGYSAAQNNAKPTVAVIQENPDPLSGVRYGLQVGGGLSPAPFELEGVHYLADMSVDFWLSDQLALQLVGVYGTSNHDAIDENSRAFSIDRVMAGFGVTWRWMLPASFAIDTYGRVGHQWFIKDNSGSALGGDALSFRAELGAVVGYQLADQFHFGVRGSGVMDIITVDKLENREFFPQGGLVLGYRY